MKFQLQSRTRYPMCFAVVMTIAVASAVWLCWSTQDRVTIAITTLTGIAGFFGFVYGEHAQALSLFRELFRDFNARYDALNDKLNVIVTKDNLDQSDKATLCDYFNLCAEEYMFFSAGCVDTRVWRAWHNGMLHFAQHPPILAFWKAELNQDSYYGFPVELLTK